MTQALEKPSPKVPHWLIRTIWLIHRAVYSLTRGRFGLRAATDSQWGMLRLRTVGRKSGRERVAIVGFLHDGPNVIIPAMNGWMEIAITLGALADSRYKHSNWRIRTRSNSSAVAFWL